MKTNKMNLTILAALILLTATAIADEARATVRIDATLSTPGLHVRVGNGHHPSTVTPIRGRNGHGQGHGWAHARVNEQDRRMAKRLARYIGVPARELLRMKRSGYRWSGIGRELGLPRAMVRAARSMDSWKRYVRHDRRQDWCGTHARVDRRQDRRDRQNRRNR